MNNLFTYLIELNISLLILYAAYRILLGRDKNFMIRRIYLLVTMLMPFLAALIPHSARSVMQGLVPVNIQLEELTVTASSPFTGNEAGIPIKEVAAWVYLSVLSLGLIRLSIQVFLIMRTVYRSGRLQMDQSRLVAAPSLHASSFFGYVFIDPDTRKDNSFRHILEHEEVHCREWHSVDRVLAEFLVIINWFNPMAWMVRRSVVQNLEYLADSGVVGKGADVSLYQLSILNQYIGSASISNNFSSHIKKRIKMLNKNDKPGSRWKLAMLFPLVVFTLVLLSCAEKEGPLNGNDLVNDQEIAAESKIYDEVEVMPAFRGGDINELRKYIAYNVMYPKEAAENGVSGKVFVTFVVTKEGTVRIPGESEFPPKPEKEGVDEVVVVTYRPIAETDTAPDEKYVKLLKEEAVRVITSASGWEPGKINGKPVNVMMTMPINFVLQ